MDYNYLVPANSKKQTQFLGFLGPTDIPILIVGIVLTIILLLVVGVETFWMLIIDILPVAICAFLVFPMPNYHNVRVFIREMYRFYFVKRRKYVLRGWCYKYEQSDEQFNEQ